MRFPTQRRSVVECARRLNESGLNQGTSGNVSLRVGDVLLVTPTGMPCDALSIEDIVEVQLDGHVPGHQRLPSSEWRIHRDLYAARPDVEAVVHAHPMFCTTLACLRRGIPPFHYMVAAAGGKDVRCAPYATFGTEELSRNVLGAIEGRLACLMANHGMVAVGRTLEKALKVALEVENLAGQYWRALQIGEPYLLDDAEMDRVIEKFRTYGQQPGRRSAG